jgi:hypothetical protein
MGTSGAYGGSGAKPWEDAHDAYDAAGGAGAAGGPSGPDGPGPSDVQIENFVSALMKALAGGAGPAAGSSGYPLSSLRPGRGGGGNGGGGGGGGGGSSSSGASRGGRNLGRQTARGAAGVAGASALRSGDSATLAELGLDLTYLESLSSSRAKCVYIADTVLGAPSHPDDVALRAATLRTMVDVLRAKEPLAPAQEMRLFLQNLVYEQVLVELTSQQRADNLTPQRAKEIEDKAKKYLRTSVSKMSLSTTAKMSAQAFVNAAATLAQKVFAVFKIRGAR